MFNFKFDLDSSRLKAARVAETRRFQTAAVQAVLETSREVELEYEAATAAAGLPKLARVWNSRLLRLNARDIARGDWAVGLVYPKGGARTRGAIRAYGHGAQIKARTGMLWWPTGYNKAGGRRNERASPARITTEQMMSIPGAFVIPAKNGRGVKLWCLPANEAQKRNIRTGRITRMAIVGANTEVGKSRKKGVGVRANMLLDQGFVPMFIGMPEVNVTQRFDLKAGRRNGIGRLRAIFIAKVGATSTLTV